MALSLTQIKQRGQQISAKQDSGIAKAAKKRALAPWEEIDQQVAPLVKNEGPNELRLDSEPVIVAPVVEILATVSQVRSPVLDLPKIEATILPELSQIKVPSPSVVKLETTEDRLATPVDTGVVQEKPRKNKPEKVAEELVPTKIERSRGLEYGETSDVSFSQISGIQRKLVIYVFKDCLNRGSLESSPLSVEHLSQSLLVAYHSIKKSVDRLQQRLVLERAKFKNGRGGWTQYRIARPIYQELNRLNRDGLLPEIETADEIRTPAPKLETTRDQVAPNGQLVEPVSELSANWESIDIEPLQQIGFSKYHLKQISSQQKLKPEEVQDSIRFFAFDLTKNAKAKEIKGDPLNFFMGIVRKGIPYVPPKNYLSAEEESRNQYLNFLKQKENDRLEQEKEIWDFELQNWKANADLTVALSDAPEFVRGKQGPILNAYLSEYFEKNVWPNVLKKFEPNSDERMRIAEEIRQSLDSVSGNSVSP